MEHMYVLGAKPIRPSPATRLHDVRLVAAKTNATVYLSSEYETSILVKLPF